MSVTDPPPRPRTRDKRRRLPAPRAHFFWRVVFPALVVLAGAAVGLLGLAGARTMIDSTIGRVDESAVFGPEEPGYLAFVAPTPTLLVLHTHEGALAGITLLTRPDSDAGGTALLLTADLLLDPGFDGDGARAESLATTYAAGGAPAVEVVLEGLFGFGFGEVVEATRSDLAAAMVRAEPLAYRLTDDLVAVEADGTTRVVHPSGSGDLSASAAADVYGFRNPGEADAGRVERQRSMWEAWLHAVSQAYDAGTALPSPESALSPLSPFLLAALDGATVDVAHVLASSASEGPAEGDPGSDRTYVMDHQSRAWLRDWASRRVPWPRVPTSFQRPTVQMLDGIGDPAVRDALADDVMAAGGIITVIGNAGQFGRAETLVAYHIPEAESVAEAIAVALRLGDKAAGMAFVEVPEGAEYFVDVTVTIGSDLASP